MDTKNVVLNMGASNPQAAVGSLFQLGTLYSIASLIAESLQIDGYAARETWGWPSDFLQRLEHIANTFQIRVDDDRYLALFYIITLSCTGLAILAVALSLFCDGGEGFCGCVEAIGLGYVMVWAIEILMGFLFLPMADIVVEAFHCEDGKLSRANAVTCWEGQHIALVTLALVTGIAFGLGQLYYAQVENEQEHTRKSFFQVHGRVQYVSAKERANKFIIVLVGVFLPKSPKAHDTAIMTAIMFIFACTPLMRIVHQIPYLRPEANILQAAMNCTEVWVYFSAIICYASYVENDSDTSAANTLLAFPVIFVIGAIAMYFRLRSLEKSMESAQSEAFEMMSPFGKCATMAKSISEDVLLLEADEDEGKLSFAVRGDEGMVALSQHLFENPQFRWLEVKGPAKFAGLVQEAKHLVTSEGFRHLAGIVATNPYLEVLGLDSHVMDSACGAALCAGLQGNTQLRSINLWRNQINDEVAIQIANALFSSFTLEKVQMANNPITAATRDQLMAMFPQRILV